ncbi:response regulator transcription factor [Leucobacter sp. HY1908]
MLSSSRVAQAALLVIRGIKGMGKSTLARQFAGQRRDAGDMIMTVSGVDMTAERWGDLADSARGHAAQGVAVTVVVDDAHEVAGFPLHDAVLELLESITLARVIVVGSQVAQLDLPAVGVRVPMHVIADGALAFTADEVLQLARARLTEQVADIATRVFELTRGWPAAVHRLLARANFMGSNAALEQEMVQFCEELLLPRIDEIDAATRAALTFASALPALNPGQLMRACNNMRSGVEISAARADEILEKLSHHLLHQRHVRGTRQYYQHPFMRGVVWAHRRKLMTAREVSVWADAFVADDAEVREGVAWLALYAAFDLHDWSTLDSLMVTMFSEDFIDPAPLLRAQIRAIPSSAKKRYPLLHLAALVEEFAFPRGRRERVLFELRGIADKSVSTQSHTVGPIGLLTSGMRLAAARLTGDDDVYVRMLDQVATRLNEMSPAETVAHRTMMLTVCAQLAVSYWYREEYDEAKRWCREGLNLAPAHLTSGEVHLRSLSAAIAAWRGDMPRAEELVAECQRNDIPEAWRVRYAAVPYWIALALVSIEAGDWEQAESTYDAISWRLGTNENWPFMVWVRAHIIEHRVGGVEALSWVRAEMKLHTRGFALATGPLRALNDLHARLAWKYGRPQLITPAAQATGLERVYAEFAAANFQAARSAAAGLAESAARTGMWRMRARALLLQVIAEHELGGADEAQVRERARALLTQYKLSTPRLERPAWWDTTGTGVPHRALAVQAPAENEPQPGTATARPASVLTRAEIRTLRAVARHGTTPAAAKALHLSVHTVRDHVKAIYKKLGVSSRDDAIRAAAAAGLLAAETAH